MFRFADHLSRNADKSRNFWDFGFDLNSKIKIIQRVRKRFAVGNLFDDFSASKHFPGTDLLPWRIIVHVQDLKTFCRIPKLFLLTFIFRQTFSFPFWNVIYLNIRGGSCSREMGGRLLSWITFSVSSCCVIVREMNREREICARMWY